MAGYASSTSVTIDRTKAEIENALRRHGAGKFSSGWDEDAGIAFVAFHCQERLVRFTVPMPKRDERRFTHTGTRNQRRSASQAAAEYEQEKRAVWRRLLLVIRAKLESVDSQIETFEESFLAQIVTSNGETMGTWAKRELALSYSSGAKLPALPAHQG